WHANTLEFHFIRIERFGGIHSHLGPDAVSGGRIELGALTLRDNDKVPIGLKARRHGPFHFSGIANVYVFINDNDVLYIIVSGECAHHYVLGLAFRPLADLHIEVIPADATSREMHVAHVWKTAAQVREQCRFARDGTQQQVLKPAANDGVEYSITAPRDRRDFNYMALCTLAVVLRKFAKGPFRFTDLRQHASFDDDLRIGRHAQFVGNAFHHTQRRAMQGAGDRQLIEVNGGNRLR